MAICSRTGQRARARLVLPPWGRRAAARASNSPLIHSFKLAFGKAPKGATVNSQRCELGVVLHKVVAPLWGFVGFFLLGPRPSAWAVGCGPVWGRWLARPEGPRVESPGLSGTVRLGP